MELPEFFRGRDESRRIFSALPAIVEEFGEVEIRITKSQIAFNRRTAFAWAWIPGIYLTGDRPPLVLSLSLLCKDVSPP